MVTVLVIDSSIFIASCLPDEEEPMAISALQHVAAMGGVAPRIWWYEIRNALLMSERRNRISREQATDAIAQSRKLYVEIDDSHDEFSLAGLTRRFNLTIYDAAYLEVALRRGLPLATLDKRLRAAAREVGVALHDEAGAGSSGAP